MRILFVLYVVLSLPTLAHNLFETLGVPHGTKDREVLVEAAIARGTGLEDKKKRAHISFALKMLWEPVLNSAYQGFMEMPGTEYLDPPKLNLDAVGVEERLGINDPDKGPMEREYLAIAALLDNEEMTANDDRLFNLAIRAIKRAREGAPRDKVELPPDPLHVYDQWMRELDEEGDEEWHKGNREAELAAEYFRLTPYPRDQRYRIIDTINDLIRLFEDEVMTQEQFDRLNHVIYREATDEKNALLKAFPSQFIDDSELETLRELESSATMLEDIRGDLKQRNRPEQIQKTIARYSTHGTPLIDPTDFEPTHEMKHFGTDYGLKNLEDRTVDSLAHLGRRLLTPTVGYKNVLKTIAYGAGMLVPWAMLSFSDASPWFLGSSILQNMTLAYLALPEFLPGIRLTRARRQFQWAATRLENYLQNKEKRTSEEFVVETRNLLFIQPLREDVINNSNSKVCNEIIELIE